MKPTPTRRPDAATRRAQLLDAADAVFIAHGVNAPLELVVERAGVGRATLYRQFPDRDAILLALIERTTELLQAQAQALQDRPDAFFALMEYMSERIMRSPALSDYWRSSSLSDPRFAHVRHQVWNTFAPALERAQAQGLVRADVQARDLSLLIGMLGAALRGTSDAERRRLAQQALDIIRRGLQPEAARDTASNG